MVVKVEQHALIILSDTTKEHVSLTSSVISGFLEHLFNSATLSEEITSVVFQICVFADDVVESSEVTSGVTRIGDYELHDLVLLE